MRALQIERTHQMQWAAQYAVASELCKRGYEVAFTSGHTTPVANLMAVSPVRKKMFLVDVKGLYRKNPWIIKRKPPRGNLFYILVMSRQGVKPVLCNDPKGSQSTDAG